MFCPNCGQNCGEARFCSNCGTQIQLSAVVQTEPNSGQKDMICPQCGSVQFENGCCAYCGVQVMEESPQSRKTVAVSADIPCGVYNGVTSSLTLYEKECVVRTTILFVKKYETRIPYDKITSVVYVRPLCKASSIGYLLFRWEGNCGVEIPANHVFSADKTTITTSTSRDTLFYHIYCMLKAIAPSTAEFKEVIPPVDISVLESWASKTDIDTYFDKYAPYRNRAVEAVCKQTGASEMVATELINCLFDMRQRAMYTADPAAAIRDLKLIVGAKISAEELAAQERAKKKERNKRDALLYEMRKRGR